MDQQLKDQEGGRRAQLPGGHTIAGYGWRRDQPDHRDHIFNLEQKVLRGFQVPAEVDLAGEMPPVYNQLQLGSCTANGSSGILEHQAMAENEGTSTPSRLFVYYETRRIEGTPENQDSGGQVRDAVKVLVTEGAPPETEWPYSDANPGPFSQKPPDRAYQNAVAHEALAYSKIVVGGAGAPIRTAVAAHHPIVFGFSVPAQFEDPNWDPSTTPLPYPDQSTQFIGGHCVVVVGYDYSRSRFAMPVFKVRNSWGGDWGDAGHFFMPADWFSAAAQLATDLWVVTSVK